MFTLTHFTWLAPSWLQLLLVLHQGCQHPGTTIPIKCPAGKWKNWVHITTSKVYFTLGPQQWLPTWKMRNLAKNWESALFTASCVHSASSTARQPPFSAHLAWEVWLQFWASESTPRGWPLLIFWHHDYRPQNNSSVMGWEVEMGKTRWKPCVTEGAGRALPTKSVQMWNKALLESVSLHGFYSSR